jgi:long-chain acyl-CoA synthetase
MLPRFDPAAALAAMVTHGVTVFAGVPTMYAALIAAFDGAGFNPSNLRVCVSGGAALPVEILHEFETLYACPILEGYGLSETSPVACFNHPDAVRKPGSIGTPIAGVRMRVQDDDGRPVPPGRIGEIAVAGHNVMKGYWQQPAATATAIVDGWFRTGDLGRIDEDGYYFIVDRKKDLIIRGGYNVYPREIEEVLYEHPAVAEAAVVGVPHPSLGEEVAAVIALKPGSGATPGDIKEFIRQQVAAYKYPRTVHVVDALPKGPTGKILKREIVVPAEAGRS